MSNVQTSADVSAFTRVLILLAGAAGILGISWATTGSPLPEGDVEALMVQSGLLLVLLGSTVIERNFSSPAEALVNSLTALVSVMGVARFVAPLPLSILAGYLTLVLIAALVTVARQRASGGVTHPRWAQFLYRFCSEFGRARVLFSVVFLTAVLFFLENPTSGLSRSLVVFWGLFLALWPLSVPQLFDRLIRSTHQPDSRTVGKLERIDSPGLARISLLTDRACSYPDSPAVLVSTADGQTRWGVPLFSENRDGGRWGTVLLTKAETGTPGLDGFVQHADGMPGVPSVSDLLGQSFGLRRPSLVGLVQENSQVGAIRIELLADSGVRVGTLLAVVDGEETVFYQVVKGLTREEAFDGLHFGSRVATATQIGTLEGSQFRKFRWLPPMNAPVFLADPEVHEPVSTDFVLGTIPESTIKVSGNFAEEFQMHTAILGATGTGKTEFAFDVIRHAVGAGVRVLCIDLTAQYRQRLGDLRIEALSVSERQEEHLSKNFRAIETGEYGGFKEKAAFDQFASPIEAEVATRLGNFIASSESDLGLLELTAVSNTKATLWITEQYLRSLLELGRSGRLERPVLVVVEEAHTVMPEMNFVGDGSYDTRGTIARISQIALQGRKYGIGLLVIAQRTATVSKSVLTQCNTVISFSCMDETSIAYLSNVFGSEVAETLPQLPRRHAVAYGPWVRSESPIAFEVPFDEQKAQRPTFAASRVEPPNHPEEPTAEGVGWFPEEPPF